MAASRKKRRADGKLRPAVARYKRKKEKLLRRAWLARFDEGARGAFFASVDLSQAIFLKGFAKTLGVSPQEKAAELLEMLGQERGWLILRTSDGLAVGIGPEIKREIEPCPDCGHAFPKHQESGGCVEEGCGCVALTWKKRGVRHIRSKIHVPEEETVHA